MRTEQLTAKALSFVNDDRYQLALLVAARAGHLANGAEALVKTEKGTSKFTDIALLEIAEGKISIESYIEEE